MQKTQMLEQIERTEDALFPVMLKLQGRLVLVVGGGPVAAGKVRSLLDAGAKVRLVAPDIELDRDHGNLTHHRRRFRPSDIDGCWVVVSAATPAVNRDVSRLAERRRIFVIAVDDPSNCSAYSTAVVRRNRVTVAVSTDGAAPALAGLLREALEDLLPIDVGSWLRVASSMREEWRRDGVPMAARRPLLLRTLNRLYEQRGRTGPLEP